MIYLLDTDVLSNLMRPAPSIHLVRRLGSVPAEDFGTSSINLGELLYGAHRSGPTADRYLRQIESLVEANMAIVPFDRAAARAYGTLRADLERLGTPIGDGDTRIAATALSRQLTVVTGNVRDFARVPGLAVQNWLTDDPR